MNILYFFLALTPIILATNESNNFSTTTVTPQSKEALFVEDLISAIVEIDELKIVIQMNVMLQKFYDQRANIFDEVSSEDLPEVVKLFNHPDFVYNVFPMFHTYLNKRVELGNSDYTARLSQDEARKLIDNLHIGGMDIYDTVKYLYCAINVSYNETQKTIEPYLQKYPDLWWYNLGNLKQREQWIELVQPVVDILKPFTAGILCPTES